MRRSGPLNRRMRRNLVSSRSTPHEGKHRADRCADAPGIDRAECGRAWRADSIADSATAPGRSRCDGTSAPMSATARIKRHGAFLPSEKAGLPPAGMARPAVTHGSPAYKPDAVMRQTCPNRRPSRTCARHFETAVGQKLSLRCLGHLWQRPSARAACGGRNNCGGWERMNGLNVCCDVHSQLPAHACKPRGELPGKRRNRHTARYSLPPPA
jgi:hypothetical protein